MAGVLGISPTTYRLVQSVSPGTLLEIWAPLLMAFGVHALQGLLQSNSQPQSPQGKDVARRSSQRRKPRKTNQKSFVANAQPVKRGTRPYWLQRLAEQRPDLATLVRNGNNVRQQGG